MIFLMLIVKHILFKVLYITLFYYYKLSIEKTNFFSIVILNTIKFFNYAHLIQKRLLFKTFF